jgi:methylglutaconyl-CoA hydratase
MAATVRAKTDARGVATVTLARAEKHNALDAATMDALTAACTALAAAPGLRAVVLAAEGPTFCAGGDLGWMRAQAAAAPADRAAEAARLAAMLAAVAALPVPVIARVQGPAWGGGVGLLCACDLAIGTPAVRWALTEARLGLIPAVIAPHVLARLGPAARPAMLTARTAGAAEALACGLLSDLVEPAALDAAVAAAVDDVLRCAPGALAAAKALLARLDAGVAAGAAGFCTAALAERWQSAEAAAGIAAFFARRPPPWAGG